MARIQRELSTTGYYHIMLRGNERKRIFIDNEDRQKFIDTLERKEEETNLSIYAYCLMDNHVHLVIQDDDNKISGIMKGIATRYAMFFNNKYQRVGHLFQDRFKSEAIEDDRYLMAVIRYVHNNPVQAGMLERCDQYKWSSYQEYINPNKVGSKLVDSKFILGMISTDLKSAIREFERFSRENNEDEFMDDIKAKVLTLEEGKEYFNEYSRINWPGVSKEEIMKDTIKRNKSIIEMKSKTGLSVRK